MSIPHRLVLCRLLPAALCVGALASCSSLNSMMGGSSEQDALKALKWTYAADGVQLAVTADAHLNQSTDQPHTLAVAVVQMEDPNAFTAATSNSAKLTALLLANSPPPGMLALSRVFISPGEQRTITLPRVEKAQYVGLAAGYYHLDTARSVRLYRIGVEVDSSGIIVTTRNAAPEPLKIDLRLGPDGIQESPGTRTPPVPLTKPQAGPVAPPATTPAPTTPPAGQPAPQP
ncbi:type VI secretion system lipoprotein TssJ [Bordetella sp. BOR01]|uniref:type VI secretion system lipoprotein TssJ n=1 Tax=Bordetella sp. BOR01 TaxID=2854779 RepID=UPI0021072F36|nr:type VI secretion system lipoprotein TssJ [Bordetella sp. BOR01]